MNHMDLELYSGVISGNNEVLQERQGRPSVVNQLTPTNCTILHLASQYGNLGCVAEIISAHPSLLLKLNSRGETALHLAAREGHYGVAKALINAAKSSLLRLDDHAQTTASTVVEFLIRSRNVEFDTALHEAVRYNHLSVVEVLVTEDPNHLHPLNKNDETPLFMASGRAYNDIVEVIVDGCISPTYGGPRGETALHAAILSGNHGGIKLLQKKKDLLKVTDDYGWTSFHYAACKGYSQIIVDLIYADKSMAYVPEKKFKRIALHIAAYRGFIDVAKELLKYCPDSYDIIDGSGRNILHIAVEQNKKKFIRYVLGNCKKVNNLLLQKNIQGNTPLHVMAMFGCYVPEVFNHNQLQFRALNNENRMPLDLIHTNRVKDYVRDQARLRAKLKNNSSTPNECDLDRIMEEQGFENGKLLSIYLDSDKENMKGYEKMRKTHMIVAALIGTVALTAGFAMPGGFDGNAGSKQGSPALLRKAAFKAFVVTDTLAVLSSLSSLFIYFMSLLPFLGYNPRRAFNMAFASFMLNIFSIASMMLAFIMGTYAVLVHSLALAITVIIICSFFFPLFFYLYKKSLYKLD